MYIKYTKKEMLFKKYFALSALLAFRISTFIYPIQAAVTGNHVQVLQKQ